MLVNTDTHVYILQDVMLNKSENLSSNLFLLVWILSHLFKEMSFDKSALPKFFSVHASGISLVSRRSCVADLLIGKA